MLNAEFAFETTGPDPLEEYVFPEPERLSPGKRLDVIASVLAVSVLRSKVRKAASSNYLKDIGESSGTVGEGLSIK